MHPIPSTLEGVDFKGEMVMYEIDEGEVSAYYVEGPSESNMAVMVIHEWWGLNDHIKSEADRIFEELDGQVHVIALDMYRGEVATTRETASSLMQSVEPAYGLKVVAGAADYLPEGTQFGTIGWCFGGGWSLQAAIALEGRALGSVIYYGMPELEPANLEPLQCDVLGIFADQDGWITPEVVQQFDDAMKMTQKSLTYHIFKDTQHAFANPSRDIFNEGAAKEANQMTKEFFRSRLLQE